MDVFFQKRAKEWKKRFSSKLKESKKNDHAVEGILNDYIFYALSFRNFKYRLRKVIGTLENQAKNVSHSRKDIKDKEKLSKIAKLFKDLRKKLRTI